MLHMHQNRSRVHIGLIQVYGRYFVNCCLKRSWRHGFCQLSFFPLFFVLAHGWSILLRENSLSTPWQRTVEWDVWWKLLRAFGLVEKVSTRTLRRFIPGNFRWNSSKYVLSSVATFHVLSFWQLTGNGSYLIIFFAKISSWTKLPLCETSTRAPFKSSKQTAGG